MGCTSNSNISGQPRDANKRVTYLGMYSKSNMTGIMPGEVKIMHDGIAGLMAGDANAMRMPPDKII